MSFFCDRSPNSARDTVIFLLEVLLFVGICCVTCRIFGLFLQRTKQQRKCFCSFRDF